MIQIKTLAAASGAPPRGRPRRHLTAALATVAAAALLTAAQVVPAAAQPGAAAPAAPVSYTEPYRPQFHFKIDAEHVQRRQRVAEQAFRQGAGRSINGDGGRHAHGFTSDHVAQDVIVPE